MKEIHVLEQTTIDKIAAGEVVERPGSIVKELCENALDAGATALTVEIRDGGISMIRVTDNGEGIDPTQVRRAFLRHATSKITQVDDLVSIRSFGFRGEALSSICAVSRVELITKVRENLTGVRYKIEGGSEKLFEEVGAPAGSTFIVRDLFYNTPARRKFLKSAQTEAGYISDFVSRLAMSHPHISVKFMVNSTTRLSTSGYGSQADVINAVFGREVRSNLIEVEQKEEAHGLLLKGWIGKPAVSRGNRTCEILYVNGRLVYNSIFSKAVEEGYETFLMQHRFPFVILQLTLPGSDVDVNVHPAKAQVRFTDGPLIFDFVKTAVKEHLTRRELVVESAFQNQAQEEAAKREARKRALEAQKAKDVPEPFETLRRQHNTPEGYLNGAGQGTSPYARQYPPQENAGQGKSPFARQWPSEETAGSSREKIQAANQFLHEVRQLSIFDQDNHIHSPEKKESQPLMTEAGENRSQPLTKDAGENRSQPLTTEAGENRSQPSIPDAGKAEACAPFLSARARPEHRIIGQLFETYWIIEYRNTMYIIDQHAAHEKVMFERLMEKYRKKEAASQMISPALIVSLSLAEETLLREHLESFQRLGFEIEPFGGHDYMISAVPQDLFGLTEKEYFMEMLDSLSAEAGKMSMEIITMRVASMACKAAVKGNTRLSTQEADALITELLSLDNPYNCPHGRPTILSMSKAEIEKKFHRIV